MTRREVLESGVAAASAVGLAGSAAAAPRRLKNMGSASAGIRERRQMMRDAGKQLEMIEYCHEKGMGAAHIGLPSEPRPEDFKTIYDKLNKYDMRVTISVRTPRSDDALPRYEATVKALSEMDGRIACMLDKFSSRRYEQFKTAAEYHKFFAMCKEATRRAVPILEKYKMKLSIENHKGWRSAELVDWVKESDSEYIGVNYDMCNNVSMVETPQQTFEMLAPYSFCVSFKDMAADFYDEGILLSEVPFGEGYHDLPAVVAACQKKDPDMLFILEMITRDPLKVPIFTEDYWKIWDAESPVPPRDLAMLVSWIRENPPKKPLPKVSGLTPEERLALEDDYNDRCIAYAREHLPL